MLIKSFRDLFEDHMHHPAMNELIKNRKMLDGRDFENEEHVIVILIALSRMERKTL